MRRIRLVRKLQVAVIVAVSISLLPTAASPASAATTAEPTVDLHPEKAKPLGEGVAKTLKPEAPKGDFRNPPKTEDVVDASKPVAKGDHFVSGKSRLVERNATSNTYDNGDGTQSQDIYGAPVNFQGADGKWRAIDDTVKKGAEAISNLAGPATFSLNNKATKESVGKVSVGKNSVSFGFDNLKSTDAVIERRKGDIDRDVIVYKDVFGTADLEYTVVGSRLKESVILESAPTEPVSYRIPLKLDGLKAVASKDGSLGFSDSSGKIVVTVDPATMWDSSGTAERVPVDMRLTDGGNSIVLTPDFKYLAAPSTKYPVTVDPTYDGAGYNSVYYMDTFAHKYYSSTNYNSFYQYGAYTNQVGYDSYPAGESYTYFYQDINALNGKNIIDARWRTLVFGHSATKPMVIWPVAPSSWNGGTLTWNNKPGHRPENALNAPPANSWTNVDITSWAVNWANGTWQNSGLTIDTAGQNAYYRLAAIENGAAAAPFIRVTYSSLNTASQPTAPHSDAEVMTDTPTLTSNVVTNTDAPVKYWFKVSDTSNPTIGGITDSGWMTAPSFTMPKGSLQDGGTYTWYVITSDGTVNLGSNWAQFKVNLRLGESASDTIDQNGPVGVNLINGNVMTGWKSPSVNTVGGSMGVELKYNSQAQVQAGLTGRYWNSCGSDGMNPNFNVPSLTRTDSKISMDWGTGSPGYGIGVDEFCAEWDGYISAPTANTYCFDAFVDDGMLVTMGGQTVINRYSDGGGSTGPENQCVGLGPVPQRIHVEYYEHGGAAAAQLRFQDQSTVPDSWFSTTPGPTPQGWTFSADTSVGAQYTKAIIKDSGVILTDGDGETDEYKRTKVNGVDGFDRPADENTTLLYAPSNGIPRYIAQDAGLTYEFDQAGNLVSLVSNTDDRAPASARYIYSTGLVPARLTAIEDPVSGKRIQLKYSDGNNGGSCPAAVSGFAGHGPQGYLCRIVYPDNTTSDLYYSSSGSDAQLMRIVDPGVVPATTDFSYVNGLMNGIADPGQTQWRSGHTGDPGLYTRINYSGDRASSVVLGSPGATDSNDAPTGTNRPSHSYAYTTPFVPNAANWTGDSAETRVGVAGFNPPQGFARKVTYNGMGQTRTDTNATGTFTTNVWEPTVHVDRLRSVTDSATGLKSVSVWDTTRNLVTDTYDPAPQACLSDTGLTTSCAANTVSHSANVYDGGMNGLAISWWKQADFAGNPYAHSTSIRNDSGPSLSQNWNGTGPPILDGQLANISLIATGEIFLPRDGAHTLQLGTNGNPGQIWIDDSYLPMTTNGNVYSVQFNNPVAGSWHSIRLNWSNTSSTSTGFAGFVVDDPSPDPPAPVAPANLRPRYDLVTSTTTDDSDPGSPGTTTTTSYGPITTTTGTDPAYGIAQSTTTAGLTTSGTYELPRTDNEYLRQKSRTLPAGNTYTYSYYGKDETVTNSCTNTTSVKQAGLLKQRTSPAPATGAAITESFIYDTWGRVVASWKGSEEKTCYTYDIGGRLTSVSYPMTTGNAARTATYEYSIGGDPRVSTVSDIVGTITSKTDFLGRAVSYTDVWNRTTDTSYDLAGRVTDTVAPGDVRHMDYDSVGRVSAQKAGSNTATMVTVATPTYNPASEVTSVAYPSGTGNGGNGTVATMGYDDLHRNNSVAYSMSGTNFASDAVTYSRSGRVIDQTIDNVDVNPGLKNNFVYDAAGRLIEAKVPGHNLSYNYPTSGTGNGGCTATGSIAPWLSAGNSNRASATDTTTGSSPTTTTTTYCYDNADRLLSTSDSRYAGLPTYDSHGNTLTLGSTTMTYDSADRHVTTTEGGSTVTYVRDATDRIVSRLANGTATRYGFSGPGDSSAVVMNTANAITDKTIALVGGAMRNDRIDPSTNVATSTWSYPNIHGDVMATADATGTKQGATVNYDPYGQVLNAGSIPDNQSGNLDYGYLGSKQRGTEHEGSLNTIEMGARQYVPGLGRFIEVDPVEGGCSNDYAYVHGDPVTQTDLSGEKSCKNLINADAFSVFTMQQTLTNGRIVIAWGAAAGAAAVAGWLPTSVLTWTADFRINGRKLNAYQPHTYNKNATIHGSIGSKSLSYVNKSKEKAAAAGWSNKVNVGDILTWSILARSSGGGRLSLAGSCTVA